MSSDDRWIAVLGAGSNDVATETMPTDALRRRIADLRAALSVIATSGGSAEDAALEARLALSDDDRAARGAS